MSMEILNVSNFIFVAVSNCYLSMTRSGVLLWLILKKSRNEASIFNLWMEAPFVTSSKICPDIDFTCTKKNVINYSYSSFYSFEAFCRMVDAIAITYFDSVSWQLCRSYSILINIQFNSCFSTFILNVFKLGCKCDFTISAICVQNCYTLCNAFSSQQYLPPAVIICVSVTPPQVRSYFML